MSATEPVAPLRVEVAIAWPTHAVRHVFELPSGSCVADALALFAAVEPGIELIHGVGIFGKSCEPGTPLHDGDRVEIYRPLQVDAKQMRRERAKQTR